MPDVIEASFLRNVTEFAVPIVFEQNITATHRRYKKIGIAVIIDICKSGSDANAISEPNTGSLSDIFKLPAAEISPKLTPSQLAHEKNIEPSIAINIGNSDAAAVIVISTMLRA